MISHPANTLYYEMQSVEFLPPRNRHYPLTVAWSIGSAAIGDTSEDQGTYFWEAYQKDRTIVVRREDLQDETVVADLPDGELQQLDFCFDQSMRPVVVFVVEGKSYMRYFKADTYITEELPPEIKCPRVVLDKPKISEVASSDVILGYTHDGKLCYRQQRDRYLQEYVIGEDPNRHLLWRIGIMRDGRVGFQWR